MRRILSAITAAVIALAAAGCGGGHGIRYERPSEEAAAKSWTVLIYMMGGNEETQHGSSSKKLREIMSVDYPDNVRVAVETGGSAVWHEKGVYSDYNQRFEAGRNALYLADQTISSDMGESNTLRDFLTWGISRYKSDKYMLVIAGSGGGSMNGIGSDELFGADCLTIDEISYAMNLSGRSFDLVCMDASLMGGMETAAALSTCADYLAAPQSVINPDTMDYASFLSFICDNPGASAPEAGQAVCDSAYMRAAEKGCEKEMAISVIDVARISTLGQAFDGMAGDMLTATDSLTNYKNLSDALSKAHIYGGASADEGYSDLMDLGDAAVKIREFVGGTADRLLEELAQTVVYKVCGDYQSESSGMSVYYPLDMDSGKLQQFMDISLSGKYKEFLRKVCISCDVRDAVPDYTESWAWNTYSEDMEWLEYRTVLDGNSYELYISGNMDLFRDVGINVYKLDKSSGKYVFVGKHHDIDSNWEGGIFKDNFDRTLPSLGGRSVSMTLLRSCPDYDLYSFPAAVSGERSNIRVRYYPAEDRYEIAGAFAGLNGNGQAGAMENISSFGSATPLLTVYDEQHSGREYVMGGQVKKLKDSVQTAKTENGEYIFEYEITDIYGLKRYGTPVTASVSGKGILY